MPDHSFSKEIFPNIQSKPPLMQLEAISSPAELPAPGPAALCKQLCLVAAVPTLLILCSPILQPCAVLAGVGTPLYWAGQSSSMPAAARV